MSRAGLVPRIPGIQACFTNFSFTLPAVRARLYLIFFFSLLASNPEGSKSADNQTLGRSSSLGIIESTTRVSQQPLSLSANETDSGRKCFISLLINNSSPARYWSWYLSWLAGVFGHTAVPCCLDQVKLM